VPVFSFKSPKSHSKEFVITDLDMGVGVNIFYSDTPADQAPSTSLNITGKESFEFD
jgi:hypothetical protein